MKKLMALALSACLLAPTSAFALSATTVDGHLACRSKDALDAAFHAARTKQRDKFQALIDAKICVVLKAGVLVEVVDSPGVFGTTVVFRVGLTKFWAPREALTNYKP